ncbi:MAG: permease [Candidatus Dormibacteria bacterium]
MVILQVLVAVLQSLRMAFFMFWDTLWPLVFGFGLSGAVQAFVSRDEMRRLMGDHRPRAIARASLFGAASSSCSYAASAMAKSLFQKGADFTTAMIFMIASTNLVLELGLVLWILIGWQFALSEYVGGVIMIALMAGLARFFLKPALVEVARARLAGGGGGMSGHEAHAAMAEERRHLPWARRIRSRAGWADAASYTMADLIMLRQELLIGYVVAGFLAVLVPNSLWNVVFFHGHGFWTSLENVVVGPFIAVISFVCSIGNVPLAAALWKGGISFGGVVSFIFADLISLPLILIYRKFYGGALTLRLVALMWTVMSIAGLATEYIFAGLRLVPTSRPIQVVEPAFHWNYTTYLNLVFLAVFAIIVYFYKNRERLGGGQGYALDPVCGMQVETAMAPARATHDGRDYHFCSDRCHDRFVASPERFTRPGSKPAGMEMPPAAETGAEAAIDPVCGMTTDPDTSPTHLHGGRAFYFCGEGCRDSFAADPGRYLVEASP